jgi:large subunit ribosomal protein L21
MYAIIRAGGKQAKVRSGDVIEVERVKNASETIEFQPILVVDDEGTTHSASDALDGAVVTAKVLGEVKGDKVDIFKYKNKTGYRRHMGHRQTFTQLEITGIEMKKAKKAAAKKPAAKKTKSTTETAPSDAGAASEEE